MTDDEALILCAYQEARGEPDDGIAAVVRIIYNRIALKYASDGTVQGTVFRHDQFSWTEHAVVKGEYICVAPTPAAVEARAAELLAQAQADKLVWARIGWIVTAVQGHGYKADTPDYFRLTLDTVLYLNPDSLPELPDWAIPSAFVCQIGHHSFYRNTPTR